MVTFSILMATVGRPTLRRALQSVADQPLGDQDEVLVIGERPAVHDAAQQFGFVFVPCARGHNWGTDERIAGMRVARGTHLAFLDDDDIYLPGALQVMRATAAQHPDRPILFRTRNERRGRTIWKDPELRPGNQGAPQFVTPNCANRLGVWTRTQRSADFDFIASTVACYPPGALVWDPTVVYCVPRGR